MRCLYCHTELGETKYAPGAVVKVRMHDNKIHDAVVIRPSPGPHDYTTVRVLKYWGEEHQDWCVPTHNVLPALPCGQGISLHKLIKMNEGTVDL